jgi:DNA-binding transcriptional regulator YdaS (Cro superfamily)
LKIIEFLMNNIFIVVIIFGALASLFGKASSKKKPGQMPDFGGGGLLRTLFPQAGEREPSLDRPLQERSEGQPVYRTDSEPQRQHSANSSQLSRETDEAAGASQIASLQRSLERASAAKAKAQVAAERKTAGQSAVPTTVQADDLRKAVIWAEILGPPRSKRPYRK